jgi:hypothetical protein
VWIEAAVLIVLAGCIGGAMAEGTIPTLGQTPARVMPGVPTAVLGLYLLGTAWVMVSRHPVRTAIIGFLVTGQVLTLIDILARGFGEGFALSPKRVFTPVTFMAPLQDRSDSATVLWLAIFATVAVAAIRARTARDQHRGEALEPPRMVPAKA